MYLCLFYKLHVLFMFIIMISMYRIFYAHAWSINIHTYNINILWFPLKKGMPQNFTSANFGQPFSKS